MGKRINCWTPVQGVTEDNTLRYVPERHLIPDEKIGVSKEVVWVYGEVLGRT